MASILVLVSQLLVLMAALAGASHFYGGSNTFTTMDNHDGTFTVVIHQRVAFDSSSHRRPRWRCFRGECGQPSLIEKGILDSGTNGPSRRGTWTESQTILSTTVQSNKPFQLRDGSCCYVNGSVSWSLLTEVDLGTRSDTGKPNNSPDITILPFLRVPINCPRTYKLLAIDPDGDRVSCRHGNVPDEECSRCISPPNIHLDEGSCAMHYANSSRTGLNHLELVIEDFPTRPVTLSYTDGTQSIRFPRHGPGRQRRSLMPSSISTSILLPSWWQNSTIQLNDTVTSTPHVPSGTQSIPTGPMMNGSLVPSGTQSIPPGPMMNTSLVPSGTQSIPPGPMMSTPLVPSGTQSIPPGSMMSTPLVPSGTQSIPPGPMMNTPLVPSGTQSIPPGPMMNTPLVPSGTQSIPPGPMMSTPLVPSGTQSIPPGPMMSTPLVPSGTQSIPPGPMMNTPLVPSGTQSIPPGPMMNTPLVPSGTQSIPPGPMMNTPLVPSGTQSIPPGPMITASVVPSGTQGPMMSSPPSPFGNQTIPPGPVINTPPPPIRNQTIPPNPPGGPPGPPTSFPWWWPPTTPGPSTTTTQVTITTTTGSTYSPPTSGSPFSRIPLHFMLQVDPPAPSCQEGEYLPRFVHPTPRDGEHLHGEVNKESEITVKAQATHTKIYDMIFSGPLNITKRRTTRDEFVIRWTPVQKDLGQTFPLCFIVEAQGRPISDGPVMIYQSELRCVVIEVGRKGVIANVICNETSMTVEVEKDSFEGLTDHLRLNEQSDVSCSLEKQHNATHIIAVIPLNGCGTEIEEDDDNLIFKNAIITVDDVTNIITRKHRLQAEFYCQYPKRSNVTLSFTAHRSNVTVKEKGFGTFTYQFEFFHSLRFDEMIDPSSYPLEYDVGDQIYMDIVASSSVNNTELFVESCKASPYDNPSYRATYPIIENGCNVDPTVEVLSPRHGNEFKLSMEAFKFIGMHDQVYISCSVILCEAGNSNTRCSQGCTSGSKPSKTGPQRHKRETIIQTPTHYISQGPLRLRRAAAQITATSLNLNLNLVFIAGCLLAAIGMICAVAIYKERMSRVKYESVPSTEK